MEELKRQALAMQERLTALRRDFHKHPEVGREEFRTAQRIEEELDRLGIPHRRVVGTGVWATIRGTGEGSGTVVLRADIDALPLQEENDVPYRSQTDGRMHACGHDAHTACLLGGAELLWNNRAKFGGEVRLIFQPAEECDMTTGEIFREGLMDGADRVFGLHCAPDLLSGTLGIKTGANNAGVERFAVTVHGRSAHVATPHLGVDALYIASQIVVGLQALVTRRSDPVEPLLIGVGTLNAGRTYNAVAETAVLAGTTRTVSHETRRRIHEEVDRLIRATAELYGGTAETEWTYFASPLINEARSCEEIASLVSAYWPEIGIVRDRPIFLTGDDYAEYLLEAPGMYAYLGTHDPARPGTGHNIHDTRFDIDESALPLGAWFYAASAIRTLTGKN